MIDHGTPIGEVPKKELSKEEVDGISTRLPPYDGVRTWGDLLAVREIGIYGGTDRPYDLKEEFHRTAKELAKKLELE